MQTLKEFLFPNLSKIDNLYELGIIIPEMFLFLTKKEVAEELIKFDSYSYFETLTLFFFKEEEMNMMINDEMFETYLENNLNQKNKIICPLIIENIDTNKLKQNIEDYIKHPGWLVAENLLDESIRMIQCEVTAIQRVEYITFFARRNVMINIYERFRKECMPDMNFL